LLPKKTIIPKPPKVKTEKEINDEVTSKKTGPSEKSAKNRKNETQKNAQKDVDTPMSDVSDRDSESGKNSKIEPKKRQKVSDQSESDKDGTAKKSKRSRLKKRKEVEEEKEAPKVYELF